MMCGMTRGIGIHGITGHIGIILLGIARIIGVGELLIMHITHIITTVGGDRPYRIIVHIIPHIRVVRGADCMPMPDIVAWRPE